VAAIGAVALLVLGAVIASTAGLLFAAGATGGATGLVLARVADLATWVVARGEGGTLGPLDYLLTTFGPFVPGELVLAALGAAWGARSGPVQA
jgi:hypothetical protein